MSNEILTIRLGHRKGDGDRSGWVEDMTEQEAWKAGKGRWVLKASRAIECRLALILSPACDVIAEAEILGIRKDTPGSDRYEILGELRLSGQENLGATANRGKSQNPIAYLKPDAFTFVNPDKFTWGSGDLRVVSRSTDPLEEMRKFQESLKDVLDDRRTDER